MRGLLLGGLMCIMGYANCASEARSSKDWYKFMPKKQTVINTVVNAGTVWASVLLARSMYAALQQNAPSGGGPWYKNEYQLWSVLMSLSSSIVPLVIGDKIKEFSQNPLQVWGRAIGEYIIPNSRDTDYFPEVDQNDPLTNHYIKKLKNLRDDQVVEKSILYNNGLYYRNRLWANGNGLKSRHFGRYDLEIVSGQFKDEKKYVYVISILLLYSPTPGSRRLMREGVFKWSGNRYMQNNELEPIIERFKQWFDNDFWKDAVSFKDTLWERFSRDLWSGSVRLGVDYGFTSELRQPSAQEVAQRQQ